MGRVPCWDPSIDGDFKLHAPKQTVVEVSFKNGGIQKLKVTPEVRQKDIIIAPELIE